MTMKALLVGINDYAPVGPGGPDLRGCVNDVRDAATTLVALNLIPLPPMPRNLRILTDGRATRRAILEGLQWLLTPARDVDRLFFYYSGHGSWLVDTTGEEVDGRDETICPHDFATAGMIRDDEFRAMFANLRAGVTLEVVFDSCHSGTATRELVARDGSLAVDALDEEPAEPIDTIRFVEPPFDHGFFGETNPLLPVRQFLREEATKVPVPSRMNHILWAACRDNQTAAERLIGGKYRGVFSYCFFKAMRRAGANVSRAKLDTLVANQLAAMNVGQTPQLEATSTDIGQPIFREAREAVISAA